MRHWLSTRSGRIVAVALLGILLVGGFTVPQAYAIGTVAGDCDGDGILTLIDVICLLDYLFLGGPPPVLCRSGFSTGDSNGDGVDNIADAVFLLNFLFLGGPAPPPGPC